MKSTSEQIKEHQALLTGNWLTDLANTSAFLMTEVKDLNWVGFYLLQNEELFLGPFQGKTACTRIKIGRGVCGTAVAQKKIICVPDVQQFSDHIVCDQNSRSELVVPIIKNEFIFGVLDADSPRLNRFSHLEEDFFAHIVKNLTDFTVLPNLNQNLFWNSAFRNSEI